MVRDILFPKSETFRFEKETNKLILYLVGMVFILIVIYYVYIFGIVQITEDRMYYAWGGFDLILCGVPPGLSLCIMIGIHYGVENLKKDKIDCFEPRLVNAVGRVQTTLFDKTGTLTENYMKLEAIY